MRTAQAVSAVEPVEERGNALKEELLHGMLGTFNDYTYFYSTYACGGKEEIEVRIDGIECRTGG